MALTIEEAKAFIQDAKKSQENWLSMANRSWNELKKRQKNNGLWSVTPNSVKKKARYPAWFSIFKIRQPLLLSRIGIPIGRDTTQDGNDNIGATGAILKERLAINLAKSFDFFDVLCTARDDFLATNFGTVRAYYERDEIKEKVKERIIPQQTEEGDVVFMDSNNEVVESDVIGQDDEGYYIEHDQVVDVDNEKVCLEQVLYKEVYVDPDIRRWGRCNRIAFMNCYSVPEFKAMFGAKAYATLPNDTDEKAGYDKAYPKRYSIRVYEYWDKYEKETYWFAENGSDFIKPLGYMMPDEIEDNGQELNGLYNLEGFFPCPKPLLTNQPTDEFWPIPEFYQLVEIIDDIHVIFSRMLALTRAIRARLLFDNNVDGLQQALNEAAEGDAFGVPNLAQSLSSSGGSLAAVAQYIPVKELIDGLNQVYVALEQRLNTLYRLTGTSDLLQGLVTDPTQRTFGERQMTEKYALNQLAEPQKKMQEFVRDCYELMCEVALKNFKDESLDRYIMPQTLQPEDQERYRAALGMLKSDVKRFRIELETDSTIALNEEYDKQMRVELVNALTTALEKTANIAQQSPALVVPELHCLKYLIQGFRQGKLFQSEVTQAIDNVIKQAQEVTEPPFNKDEAMVQLQAQQNNTAAMMKQQENQANYNMRQYEIASRERLEFAKLQQNERLATIQSQLDGFKAQVQASSSREDITFQYNKLSSDISKAQEELSLKRDELMLEMRKVAGKEEVDAYYASMEERSANFDMQLRAVEQAAKQRSEDLVLQERVMTEQRLQAEHQLQKMEAIMNMQVKAAEMDKPEPLPPITIQMPQPVTTKKKIKVKRDALGNLESFDSEDIQKAIKQ